MDQRKVNPTIWNELFSKTFNLKSIIEKFSKFNKETKLTPSIIPDKIKQLRVFIKRDVKSKLSNKQYMTFTFLEAPLLALILAYLVRYFNVDEGIGSSQVNGEVIRKKT